MAQRYPTQYNGILAAAPAINWGSFLPALYYPQAVMNDLNRYPRPCELEALTAAAINACDGLDGVMDGIISMPQLCNFDPHSMLGSKFLCSGQPFKISQVAIAVAEAAWTGARNTDGSFLWYGLNYDAPLSTVANTTCQTNGTCAGALFIIAVTGSDCL